jgi:hypothetical protein
LADLRGRVQGRRFSLSKKPFRTSQTDACKTNQYYDANPKPEPEPPIEKNAANLQEIGFSLIRHVTLPRVLK